jgi:hypothetical protein
MKVIHKNVKGYIARSWCGLVTGDTRYGWKKVNCKKCIEAKRPLEMKDAKEKACFHEMFATEALAKLKQMRGGE